MRSETLQESLERREMKSNRVGFKRCDGCLLLQEGPGWGRPKGGDCTWQLEGHCWILGFSGWELLLSIYLPWSTGASGGRHCTWDTEMKDLTISIPSKRAVQKGGQHAKSWLWNIKLVAFSVCMCVAGGVMDEAYGGKQEGACKPTWDRREEGVTEKATCALRLQGCGRVCREGFQLEGGMRGPRGSMWFSGAYKPGA